MCALSATFQTPKNSLLVAVSPFVAQALPKPSIFPFFPSCDITCVQISAHSCLPVSCVIFGSCPSSIRS